MRRLSMIKGLIFALGANVLTRPAVEAAGVRLGALIGGAHTVLEGHHYMALRAGNILAPGRVPSLGVDSIALSADQIGDDVQMMHRSFDHQGLFHGIAEVRAPIAEVA